MATGGDGTDRGRRGLAGPRRRRALIRPAGIPVRADASLLIIAGLLAWNFWIRFDTTEASGTAAAMALAATVLFMVSILTHELAHAIEARRRGLHVEDITLYVFGGATRITTEVARPADEAAMTVVGPWTSIALGCGFGLVAHGAGAGPVGDVAGELGWLNIILGVFNLLPGAPLDGGRLLDAAVWRVTGDRVRAARVATGAGLALGALLAALGVAEMLFVSGGFVAGLWLVLIGSFLAWAASSERKAATLRQALRGRPVRTVMSPVATVPAGTSLEEAKAACLRLGRTDAALVTGPDGTVIGVLDLDAAVRRTAAQPRPGPAGALMTPVAELPAVQADSPAADLLPLAVAAPVVVLDGTAVRSVVTGTSLAAAARWMARLPREEPETPTGAGGRPGDRAVAGPAPASTGRPGRHSAGRLALLAASAGVVVSAVATVPMPIAELAPGPALDVPAMLTSQGPVHPVHGQLLLTSVAISNPTAAGVVRAFFSPEHELTWPASLVPADISPEDWAAAQVQVFRDSVQVASAAALRAAGYPVQVEGGGAVVWAVVTDSPADGVLHPGDVVTGFGGQPVASAADLAAQVARVPAGTPVTVTVRRGDQRLDLTVRPALSAELGRPALGVAVDDATPLVRLPFAVDVNRTDIGGPSAGLMTALAVYAVTTGADVTAGQVIAGTGTINAVGEVGAVGGVAQKVAAAADAGAHVFLVPSSEAATARQAANGRPLRVVPVDSFDAALRALGVSPAAAS